MIKQTNLYVDGNAPPQSGANSADQPMSSGRIKNAVDEVLRVMGLESRAVPATPKGMRNADTRTLEAYVERRKKLSAQIRAENPNCTEEEIEARLEVFGA
jgi:hypothetical protein